MIPGLDGFFDGMHHHIAHEIERANHAQGEDGCTAAEPPGILDTALQIAGDLITDAGSKLLADCHLVHSPHHSDGDHGMAIGHPDGEGFIHQTTPFTCAVMSQKMILDAFGVVDPRTGTGYTEQSLMADAKGHGWLSDNGTSLENMGRLLEDKGIACHHDSGWHHLIEDLASGHQALIAVNADELWSNHGSFGQFLHLLSNSPNHALVVKGLITDASGHVTVVVNDPGQVNGGGVEYRLDEFQAALEAGHFHYVATDQAPPDWSPADGIDAVTNNSSSGPGIDLLGALGESPSVPFDAAVSEMTQEEKDKLFRSI